MKEEEIDFKLIFNEPAKDFLFFHFLNSTRVVVVSMILKVAGFFYFWLMPSFTVS